MRRLPPLTALRSFEAAARHASFTRAAAELGVTHGAVSRQIARLEEHLGARLFRRTTRTVALTPEGEALLNSVRAAFELIEAGAERIEAARRNKPLVVSCIATFAMRWLIPRLHRFQVRYPATEVRLSAPNPPENVAPPDTDIAIRVTPPVWPADMEGFAFVIERAGPVVSPAAISGTPVERPADLARHTLLHTESRPHAWADWAHTVGVTLPAGAERRFETFYFLLQAAASGLGVAMGPLPLVADDIASGRLVAPLGFVPSGQAYYALYRRAAAADPRIRTFCEWLREEGEIAVPGS